MHATITECTKERMAPLIVPGTTIGVTLIPGFVEIRDKGIVKKRIPIRRRSFDDVHADLKAFFKARGKILAPYVLQDVLIKIGLPRVKVILDESDLEESVEEPTAPSVETTATTPDSATTTPSPQVGATSRLALATVQTGRSQAAVPGPTPVAASDTDKVPDSSAAASPGVQVARAPEEDTTATGATAAPGAMTLTASEATAPGAGGPAMPVEGTAAESGAGIPQAETPSSGPAEVATASIPTDHGAPTGTASSQRSVSEESGAVPAASEGPESAPRTAAATTGVEGYDPVTEGTPIADVGRGTFQQAAAAGPTTSDGAAPSVEDPLADIPVSRLSPDEFSSVEEALRIVEQLGESSLVSAPSVGGPKAKIRVAVPTTDEIAAAPTSVAAAPEPEIQDEHATPVAGLGEEQGVVVTQSLTTTGRTAAADGTSTLVAPSAVDRTTPSSVTRHVVKPEVCAKVIVLGEDGVGKSSLLENAGFEAPPHADGYSTYRVERVFELSEYRVRLDAWSFDDAVGARVRRREFYAGAHVVVIVFSVCDRWSFESVEFWVRETQLVNESMPPVVIVGNKKDLRESYDAESGEPPVSTKEAIVMAEKLARSLSPGGLHPVAYVETSCLSGDGVEEVFVTAAELHVKSIAGG